ncbi:MAG: dihydroorotate dehydrogenase electron transfer subunit [Coriobacteriia bacterium]|nr:dihydroorotate dehydrogenase electron transfer subunit [Coriobacteriia bacterium]
MCELCSSDGRRAPELASATVVANERLTDGIGSIVLRCPQVAAHVRPGQFVHLRIARGRDFILRRPFSIHRVHGENVEIVFQVLGRGTRELSLLGRDTLLDLVGPLGHGWEMPDDLTHVLLVGGGLGAAPLGMLAEELSARGVAVTVALGAPGAGRLVARDLFERVARQVACCTDDGSAGAHGFVTLATSELLSAHSFDCVYACGPEVMQRAVAAQAVEAGVRCQVSLERLMACGIGACLSCIVTTRDGSKRACVDGPVFAAEEVCWDDAETPPRH